jgi:hypothetical protein
MAIESKSNREGNETRKIRNGASFAALFTIAAGSGVPLGVALHNLPLGIAIGSFFGLAVGIAAHFARMRAEGAGTGSTAGRWIFAVAAAGGLVLLVGMFILFELMAR